MARFVYSKIASALLRADCPNTRGIDNHQY